MDELRDFYIRLLSSLSLDIDGDKVLVNNDVIDIEGYPIELYNVNKEYVTNDGIQAIPFNVLSENLIRYNNPAKEPVTKKLIGLIELNLNLTLKLLFTSFVQNQLNKVEYDFEAIRLHNTLFMDATACKKSSKVIYDKQMVKNISNLVGTSDKFVKLTLRSNIEVNGEKVPLVFMLKHTMLEKFRDDDIDDLELPSFRRIDRDMLRAFLTHIESIFGNRLGHSLSDDCSVAIAITKTIVIINEHMKGLNLLAKGDDEYICFFKDDVSFKDIKTFSSLLTYSSMIPSIDLTTGTVTEYAKEVDNPTTSQACVATPMVAQQENMSYPRVVPEQVYTMPQVTLPYATPQATQTQQQVIGHDNYGNPIMGYPQAQQATQTQQQVIGYDNYGNPIMGYPQANNVQGGGQGYIDPSLIRPMSSVVP